MSGGYDTESHHYEYGELSSNQFRVVEPLDPGPYNLNSYVLNCRIVVCSTERNIDPYDALSYTWGDHEKNECINVAGKDLPITWNLFSALRSLRRRHRRLWIDAICINQNDPREREEQVRGMAKIYQRARKVVIWLGPATLESDKLMSSLEVLEKRYNAGGHDWDVEHPLWSSLWKSLGEHGAAYNSLAVHKLQQYGLNDLLARSWFTRIWIIQEVAFAQAAVVCCGGKQVSSKIFSIAPTLLNVTVGKHRRAILDIMPGRPRHGSWWDQSRDLLPLLRRFRWAQASEARDKVFALLGICSEDAVTQRLSPNYRTTDVEIVKRVLYLLFGFEDATSQSTKEKELIQACPTISAMIENLDMLEKQAMGIYGLGRLPNRTNPYQLMASRFHGRYGPAKILVRKLIDRDLLIKPSTIATCAAHPEDGDATLHLLLQGRGLGFTLTEGIIEAAAQNRKLRTAVLQLLFDKCSGHIELTALTLHWVVMMNHRQTAKVILTQRNDISLKDAVLWLALKFQRFDLVHRLLHGLVYGGTATFIIILRAASNACLRDVYQQRLGVRLTAEAMATAREKGMKYYAHRDRSEVMQILLSECNKAEMNEDVARVVLCWCPPSALQLLFDRYNDAFEPGAVLSSIEPRYLSTEKLSVLFDQHGDKLEITTSLVRLVLHRFFRVAHVPIVQAILDQHGAGPEIVTPILVVSIQEKLQEVGLFVLTYCSYQIQVTSRVLTQAIACSELRDYWLLLFLGRCSDVDLTLKLACDIVGLCEVGTAVMLLDRLSENAEIAVSESNLKAAAARNKTREQAILSLIVEHFTKPLVSHTSSCSLEHMRSGRYLCGWSSHEPEWDERTCSFFSECWTHWNHWQNNTTSG